MKEAKALMGLGLHDGAYYLAGYAVECGLKACIAKRTLPHDFPSKELVQGLYTHVPRELLVKAGLVSEMDSHATADSQFRANWKLVTQWSAESRYNVHSWEDADALITAVGDSRHGVMAWIKRYW